MASCPANTVLANAAANGFFSLEDRTILLAIIGTLLPAAGSPTATATLTLAAANGIEYVDDQMLNVALAQFLCGP